MCPPADSSLGGYGILPYPRRLLWDILPQNTPNSQNLLQRCPPTDSSLGGYGILPYPRHLLWDILPRNTPNSQNLSAWVRQGCHTLLHLCASVLICGRLFSARSFRAFRAFCGNIFSPTDFTELHRLLWCALFPRISQILRVRCSPTEFTEFTEFGSVGMAGMPYHPNL